MMTQDFDIRVNNKKKQQQGDLAEFFSEGTPNECILYEFQEEIHTPNKQRQINLNEFCLSSLLFPLFPLSTYIVNPDVNSSETGTSVEKERENYHYNKLYMMQKQTHSKHHLSVIIVQRD